MTLTQFPKKKFSKIHDHIPRKKVWIFFPEMTLTHFPKSDFLNLTWIFFQEWRLLISRLLDFFQDSRIGVKWHFNLTCLPNFSIFMVRPINSKLDHLQITIPNQKLWTFSPVYIGLLLFEIHFSPTVKFWDLRLSSIINYRSFWGQVRI